MREFRSGRKAVEDLPRVGRPWLDDIDGACPEVEQVSFSILPFPRRGRRRCALYCLEDSANPKTKRGLLVDLLRFRYDHTNDRLDDRDKDLDFPLFRSTKSCKFTFILFSKPWNIVGIINKMKKWSLQKLQD
jgi:hypothetical protein